MKLSPRLHHAVSRVGTLDGSNARRVAARVRHERQLFSIAAESITDRVLQRLPVCDGVAAGEQLGSFIKQRIVVHYDTVITKILSPPLATRLLGRDLRTVLAEQREVFKEKDRDIVNQRFFGEEVTERPGGEETRFIP